MELQEAFGRPNVIQAYYSVDVMSDSVIPAGLAYTQRSFHSRMTWEEYQSEPVLRTFVDPFGWRENRMVLAHELGHLLANRHHGLFSRHNGFPCDTEGYREPYPPQLVFPLCIPAHDDDRGYDLGRRVPNSFKEFTYSEAMLIDLRVLDNTKQKPGGFYDPGNLLLQSFSP